MSSFNVISFIFIVCFIILNFRYKAFSVYLILRRRINILFQDADMVWFKDPMAYFHAYTKTRKQLGGGRVEIEAFFSDDGQRR